MTDFTKDSITILQFCDVQGISSTDRLSLYSTYKDYAFTYEDWYSKLSDKIRLSKPKDFSKVASEVKILFDNSKQAIKSIILARKDSKKIIKEETSSDKQSKQEDSGKIE